MNAATKIFIFFSYELSLSKDILSLYGSTSSPHVGEDQGEGEISNLLLLPPFDSLS
jgi:hypothetical protein